ncbi:MAG TPA: type II 3-dehydroquinate dehydratase [Gracilimonas sp.]|nr:type II 3-dehydroquinate dehydratase [Gracilimonas sp.]
MNILIINGPNLNLLGTRDPEVYGQDTLEDIHTELEQQYPDHSFSFYQSNVEGELINRVQEAMDDQTDALIINPGGYSHTSVALRDALDAITMPKVEVHLSNIHGREEFRDRSITGAVMNGIITGFGKHSYVLGVEAIERLN